MSERSLQGGFSIRRERLIHYDASRGLYGYRTLSTLDVGSKMGNTTVFIDAMTGRVLSLRLPTGEHSANTVHTWIMALHTVSIGGLPMQLFVSFMGLVVVMLGITGVWIWWTKRNARGKASSRDVARPAHIGGNLTAKSRNETPST